MTTENNDIMAMTTIGPLAVSEAQRQILTMETPFEHIRFRQGRGGKQFPYTDTAYVIRTLNLAFGWDWDFEADNEEILYIFPDGIQRPFEARCRGRLTVRIDGRAIIKTQFGSQPIEFLQNSDVPVSLGDAFKGAASDALKKCASLLGIALDLYDSDSKINLDPRKAQQQAVKKPLVENSPKSSTKAINGTSTTGPDIPTSPQALTDAVNTALGEKYYNAPNHIYNALGKIPWPKPEDKSSWADVYAAALDHARQQLAEKGSK